MDSDNESNTRGLSVRDLQQTLFPSTPIRASTSFFSNFYIKMRPTYEEENVAADDNLSKRESFKDLLSLNRDSSFTPQPPRWPTECQVLEERISHISYVPSIPEPYYVVTGKEVQPRPTGEESGIIVYQYNPISAVNYFSRSSVGGSRYLLTTNLCPEEDGLQFESRFESGNLARAIRITPNFYELYIRADLYTNRHMQWFYFKITNTKKNFLYRFSIVNFTKDDSLFNEGMRPLMYSTKDAQLHSIGWRRCGENITYYSNDCNVVFDETDQMSYTLSFTMEFPHDDDEVFLAHSYPYTYSDLEDYLTELSNHPVKSNFTTVRLLCKSLAGNNVHCVTITSPPLPGDVKKKRAIVVTARVHPGETPASWMMKGFLDYLTSDCSVAQELRDKFIFKLVPMLNPDGVIVGNNRCSLAAKDLNRQYRTVIRDAYPSIWYTKLMVRRLLEECGLAMYCDLHAHSRKHNIFIYGCESRKGAERKLQEQVFPLMLHKNTPDKFSFESCTFRITKAKEGTGRVVMWMMGVANSYTMEASFAGSTLGVRAESHFSTADLEQMGKSFCQTLLDFYDEDPKKEKLKLKIICRLVKEGSNADEPTNIRLSDYTSDEGDTSSSSSNEVGRQEEEIIPIVPPPSPIIYTKLKPKIMHAKNKTRKQIKSPNVARKPLPICKATLGLYLQEKSKYSSDSSSDSDDINHYVSPKPKSTRPRRRFKKRKGVPKKKQDKQINCAVSDCEIHYRETEIRSYSVFELVPSDNLKLQVCPKRSKTPQARVEKRNFITQQLSQVQAKLLSLKNKLWYGVDEGDFNVPLSWGKSSFFPNVSPPPPKTKKRSKKSKSANTTKDTKEKARIFFKESKPREIPLKKTQKTTTGFLRRQTAVDWRGNVKKTNSLPDNKSVISVVEINTKFNALSCDDEKDNNKPGELKKKKKCIKPRSKFSKKAKNISNAKIFIKKD